MTKYSERVSKRSKPLLGWYGVGNVALILTIFSLIIGIVVERNSNYIYNCYLERQNYNNLWIFPAIFGAIAALGTMIAVPLTHCLAGKRKYEQGYSSFQPFVGGFKYVFLQALGWTLYSACLLISILLFYLAIIGYNKISFILNSGVITSTGIGGVLSQILVLLSLRYFEKNVQVHLCGCKEYKNSKCTCHNLSISDRFIKFFAHFSFYDILQDFFASCFVLACYAIPIFGTFFAFSPIYLIYYYGKYGFLVTIICGGTYLATFFNEPQRNARRTWNLVSKNFKIWSFFEKYFYAKVIPHGKLDPNKRYLFGFSPHGIFPTTCIWATKCKQFIKHYPQANINVLGASILFFSPLVRDFCLWAGGREVTKESIKRTFNEDRSVLLIPGGQREMRKAFPSKSIVKVDIKHRGFIRQALKYGKNLVPMFSFGENETLENIRLERIQAATTKYLGFPFPMYPFGRWYAPLPNRVKITLVVGDPVEVPKIQNPTQEQVDLYHKQYYQNLKLIFEKYKAQAGYPDQKLILCDK